MSSSALGGAELTAPSSAPSVHSALNVSTSPKAAPAPVGLLWHMSDEAAILVFAFIGAVFNSFELNCTSVHKTDTSVIRVQAVSSTPLATYAFLACLPAPSLVISLSLAPHSTATLVCCRVLCARLCSHLRVACQPRRLRLCALRKCRVGPLRWRCVRGSSCFS